MPIPFTASEPWLRRKLLAWLLGPLLPLLLLDGVASYWAALHFADRAHDRSLQEIAREVALHVHEREGRPRLEIAPATERVLRVDQDDRLFFNAHAAGALLGGDADLPAPPRPPREGGPPVLYDGSVRGEPVRLLAAWVPSEEARVPAVLVQVAETLNKRRGLAWEILASVLLPQLLLIAMAGLAVLLGVSRGLQPLQRLRAAVADRSHVDLSPVDLHGVPGEVRPLVREVNELMLRLSRTSSPTPRTS